MKEAHFIELEFVSVMKGNREFDKIFIYQHFNISKFQNISLGLKTYLNVYDITYKIFSPLIPTLKISKGKTKIINKKILIFKLLKIRLIIRKTRPPHATFKIAVGYSIIPNIFGVKL